MILTHYTSGRRHWRSRGRRKEGIRERVVPKGHLTVHDADFPAWCTVRCRGLGWSYSDHPWAIGHMKPYRVVSNSPTKWPHQYQNQIPKKKRGRAGGKEINVGKLCQPNNVQTGPSSKFNWTTPRGKVVFNWSPTVGDQLNPTYHIVRTFITTITDSISDLIQVLLWNDMNSWYHYLIEF